jgi:hypothetical protein
MRYLRLVPLLVLACSATAAADDHRVDYAAMFTLCSGSTIKGLQFSHASAELTPPVLSRLAAPHLIGVIDVGGNFWGSGDDGHETDRALALYGIRGTWALGKDSPLKLIAGAMVGPVYSNTDGTGQLGLGFAPGIGLELVSKYFSNNGAIGFRAYYEGVAVGGDGDSFWRFSIGGVWRIKKP